MLKYAEKPVVRATLSARPRPEMDRKTIREALTEHFSKTFEYLAK